MSLKTSQRILCLWLPNWPVQHYLQKHPEHKNSAIAFTEKAGRSDIVVSCSARAKQFGISSGMRKPDAEALAGPDQLTVLPSRPLDDRLALQQLAAECQRFSPLVALENADAPAALLLDVNGLSPLWAPSQELGERKLLQAVDHWSEQRQLVITAAIAQTSGLACAAAQCSDWLPWNSAGDRIVANQDSWETARLLPVEALRIDESTVSTLHSLGIETVGQLIALPKASLLSRFGPQLGWRLDQLLGLAAEPLSFYEANQPFAVEWPFETAVTSSEVLESVLGNLLERLTEAMERRQCGALHLQIFFFLDASRENCLSKKIELRLFRPTICPKELAELAKLQISDSRFSHAVRKIRVQVDATAPLEIRQKKLFDDPSRKNLHELALLINRLSSRVGAEQVLRIEKQFSHDPQRSFRYLPATEYPAREYRLTKLQVERMRRMPLAFYGEDYQLIQVDTSRDNTPAKVFLRTWKQVVRTWGPERVETGWWRGKGFRRDAYWIELSDGTRLWLNFDRSSQQWRLAGEFF